MTRGRDYDWGLEAMRHRLHGDCVPLRSEHPLLRSAHFWYHWNAEGRRSSLSFSSHFPNQGIVRDSGGYATVLPWTMRFICGTFAHRIELRSAVKI